MWEKSHPEEVKMAKMKAEQKIIDEKAQKLKKEAEELAKKS